MHKYAEDYTLDELRGEIADAEHYLRVHGNSLHCGQQDVISDHITRLRIELDGRLSTPLSSQTGK